MENILSLCLSLSHSLFVAQHTIIVYSYIIFLLNI